jgi:hypothetical protein
MRSIPHAPFVFHHLERLHGAFCFVSYITHNLEIKGNRFRSLCCAAFLGG